MPLTLNFSPLIRQMLLGPCGYFGAGLVLFGALFLRFLEFGEEWKGKLTKWMGDLGYHPSRHADEFAAYVLTEPATFWRGRLTPQELRDLKRALAEVRSSAASTLDSGSHDLGDNCEEVMGLL